MVLQIGQITGRGPFAGIERKLLLDGGGKLARARIGTEGTAANALAAVPVGAGKAAVDGQLDGFAAKMLLQPRVSIVEAAAGKMSRNFFFHRTLNPFTDSINML